MKLATHEIFKPGDRETGLEVSGVWHGSQPFVVLRTCTYKEWLDEEKAQCPSESLASLKRFAKTHPFFYEISVD